MRIILPGTTDYALTLAQSHLFFEDKQAAYYVADHETGLLRSATEKQLTEYLQGGEYDERRIYDDTDEFDEELEEDESLWIPDSYDTENILRENHAFLKGLA